MPRGQWVSTGTVAQHLSDDPPGWRWESAEAIEARDRYVEPPQPKRVVPRRGQDGRRVA